MRNRWIIPAMIVLFTIGPIAGYMFGRCSAEFVRWLTS